MASKPIANIAFIGLGLMGAPMAQRLLSAKFRVRVWNRSSDKILPLVAAGATAATSPADAANGADVILLCLADAPAIEAVLFGDHGIAQSAAAPRLLVDFSTIGPDATLKFSAQLRTQCGTSWVDAPVSGGAAGAQSGKLIIFAGGSEHDIERAGPVFNVLGQRYSRIGDLGAGQTLKLCNQLIVATNLVAIAEALALARASGLDPTVLPDTLAGGFADSLPLQIFGRRMASRVDSPILGELGLMLKDLHAVQALAQAHQSELPMTAAALDIYRHAASHGFLRRDLSSLIELYSRPGSEAKDEAG